MSRAARFAAVLGTMHAAHNLADHVLQTDRQAMEKTSSWRAMAGHVGSYHAAQVAALAAADRALGLKLSPLRTAVAVAFSAGTHAFLDRRWPVKSALELTGSRGFASGATPSRLAPIVEVLTSIVRHLDDPSQPIKPLPDDTLDPSPVPLHGPYLADQALHHACLWLAALIAASGTPTTGRTD